MIFTHVNLAHGQRSFSQAPFYLNQVYDFSILNALAPSLWIYHGLALDEGPFRRWKSFGRATWVHTSWPDLKLSSGSAELSPLSRGALSSPLSPLPFFPRRSGL